MSTTITVLAGSGRAPGTGTVVPRNALGRVDPQVGPPCINFHGKNYTLPCDVLVKLFSDYVGTHVKTDNGPPERGPPCRPLRESPMYSGQG